MTDKQMHSKNLSVELDKSRTTATSLIIDGVDVSECKYFSKYRKIVRNNECIVDMQNACIEEIETKPCNQKHNCYFKNWQRKEQECEQQKAELQKYKDNEQQEKEMQKLYNKFNGNSLIEKCNPTKN